MQVHCMLATLQGRPRARTSHAVPVQAWRCGAPSCRHRSGGPATTQVRWQGVTAARPLAAVWSLQFLNLSHTLQAHLASEARRAAATQDRPCQQTQFCRHCCPLPQPACEHPSTRANAGLCQIYGVPPLTLGIGSMAHEQLYWSVSPAYQAVAARLEAASRGLLSQLLESCNCLPLLSTEGTGASTCHASQSLPCPRAHPLLLHLRCPALQCAAPWPEDRLDEIGGRGAAYIQDFLEKRVGGLTASWQRLVVWWRRGPLPESITDNAGLPAEARGGFLHLLDMWRRRRVHAARRLHSCIMEWRLAGGSHRRRRRTAHTPARITAYRGCPCAGRKHLALRARLAGGGREAQASSAGPVWRLEPAGKLDLQP